jgi:hypothetical protein
MGHPPHIRREHIAKMVLISLIVTMGFPLAIVIRNADSSGGVANVRFGKSIGLLDASVLVYSVDGTKTLQWCFEYAEDTTLSAGFVAIAQQLNPLPSFLGFALPSASLAEYVGVSGRSGIPMPALGELFFRLGGTGIVLLLLAGCALAYFEAKYFGAHSLPPHQLYFSRLFNLAVIYGTIISVHSHIRASTRPCVWVLILWGLYAIGQMTRERPSISRRAGRGKALSSCILTLSPSSRKR